LEKKVLITGGIKSGKSRFALKLAGEMDKEEKLFIATARPFDMEMQEKIEKHKRERGRDYKTLEEPIKIGAELKKSSPSTTVIDCLTLWLSNLIFETKETEKEKEIKEFIEVLEQFEGNLVIVTNEVGSGIISSNEVSRSYQSELGRINQDVAQICDNVYMLVSGIPLKIK